MNVMSAVLPANGMLTTSRQTYNFLINWSDEEVIDQVSYHHSDMIRVLSIIKSIDGVKAFSGDYSNFPVNLFIEILIKYKINILIFDSSNYQIVSNFPSIFLTCKAIKQQIPECLIILSGRDPSFFSKQIISAIQDIDIVIKGETENTLKELISVYLHGRNIGQKLYDILGITFRSSKNLVIQTKERPFVKNLDELPYPSYEALNIDSKTIAMIASARGCPFSCNFCYKMSRIVRTHTPSYVINLMERLFIDYGIEHFTLDDEITGTNIKWLEAFSEELKTRKLKIRYNCYGRADMIKTGRLELLKSSGCYELRIGVESGSEKILNSMNKSTKKEIFIEVFKKLKEYDIKTLAFILVGYPPENHETIQETIDLLSIIRPTMVSAKVVQILPGTKLYYDMISSNKIDDSMYFFNPYYLHPRGGLSLNTLQAYSDNINKTFNSNEY